jgi:hypothetical protein
MRLLPRMCSVEAQVGIRMKKLREWKPGLSETSHVLPGYPVLLATSLDQSEPAFAHLTSKA